MTRFDRLGQFIAREQDALLEHSSLQAEVRERLETFEPDVRVTSSHKRAWLWSGAAALSFSAAAAVGLLVVKDAAPVGVPLALHIGQSSEAVQVGRFVEAPASSAVLLNFSDGSRIAVAERARARVVGLAANGADVLLESGSIHVQVKHREHSSWHIGAGPFGVHVTGTRFDVRWKAEDDAFELTLHEGQVEVSGCVFGDGYRVRAGQTVRASCRNEHFDVSSTEAESATGAESSSGTATGTSTETDIPVHDNAAAAGEHASSTAPPAAAAAFVIEHTTQPPSRRAASAVREPASWQSAARAGRYTEALRAAQTLGFDAQCERANAEQLSLLADVARYGHDAAGEAHALRLLRERFRGTKRAAQAAFALGRLESDNHGAYAEAAEWFRVYLKEQPGGELAREASGRLLESTHRAGRVAAARELAGEYLHQYPQGPHSELARSLTK